MHSPNIPLFSNHKVEIKKAEPRDTSKAQEEGGQWGAHPDNHWGMPVGPPGMPGLNNVSTLAMASVRHTLRGDVCYDTLHSVLWGN